MCQHRAREKSVHVVWMDRPHPSTGREIEAQRKKETAQLAAEPVSEPCAWCQGECHDYPHQSAAQTFHLQEMAHLGALSLGGASPLPPNSLAPAEAMELGLSF